MSDNEKKAPSTYEPLKVEYNCEHDTCHALEDAKVWLLNEAANPATEFHQLLMKAEAHSPIVTVKDEGNKAALILAEICRNIHAALLEELLLEMITRAEFDEHRN